MNSTGETRRLMRRVLSSLCVVLVAHEACAQSSGALVVPQWAKDAVWYQIFPERFRNGDTTNDPTAADVWLPAKRPWHLSRWGGDWYALQEWERETGLGFYDVVFDRRYGGDLQGVIEKLDYLKDLGITAIYFNPLFDAPSLHKYDASTYHHIDANFGPRPSDDRTRIRGETDDPASWSWTSADSLFLRLVNEAHRRGIRVIIDGVFNHCGIRFWAFVDVRKNQQASPYAKWFDIVSWDDPATPQDEFDYKAWWGFKLHPEFHEDADGFIKPVRDYFFAITRRWMDPNGDGDPSDGIDGWRLDVPNDVSPAFWRQWRRLVKGINPQAYLVGEIWDDASEWLSGDRFDAVMNYRFARAVVRFFIDTDARHLSVTGFDDELRTIRDSYPADVNPVLQNLLDSHDTDRLASMVVNPNRIFDDRANSRENPQYDIRKPTEAERKIQRLIILFQMTSLGAPMIYYGDEAGMWGGDDPDCRKPMVWPDIRFDPEVSHPLAARRRGPDEVSFDSSLYAYYRALVHLRLKYASLRRGDVAPVIRDDDAGLYAYSRSLDDETLLVIINNSSERRHLSVPLPGRWDELWRTGQVARIGSESVSYTMEPKTGLVLRLIR